MSSHKYGKVKKIGQMVLLHKLGKKFPDTRCQSQIKGIFHRYPLEHQESSIKIPLDIYQQRRTQEINDLLNEKVRMGVMITRVLTPPRLTDSGISWKMHIWMTS